MNDRPVRRVLIAGGGTAGWMVAAGLAKCLGRQIEIRLLESEEIGTVGVGEATIPTLHFFHDALGLDEQDFMQATQASFKLGIQFEDWRRPGERYLHAFGQTGQSHWTASFQHFWLEGRRRGLAGDYAEYSLEHRAAQEHRFARLPDRSLNYAYHFDAGLYAAFLRRYAESLGVERIEGRIAGVEQDPASGFVSGLALSDGRRLEAELFVDCTGLRSLLLGETLGVPFEDWSHWLPCDSAVAAQTGSVGEILPFTRAIAQPWGWQWCIPLQHRVGNGLVYSSRHLADEDAKAALLARVQGQVLRPPRIIKFKPGQRELVWKHNVVAIGLSSGFIEPLESTSIHLIQQGLTRLVQLFPVDGICQSDIDEYNRQTRDGIETVRDFVILHYHLQARDDSDFWRRCREMAVPELLRHRIRHFRDTGRVMLRNGELFSENSWVLVLMGQGGLPAGHHPITRQMDDRALGDFLGEIRRDVARRLVKLPRHEDFLRQYCPPVPALRINPKAELQTITLDDGSPVYVVDDFVENPELLVALAQHPEFQPVPGHPFPGHQLPLPVAMTEALQAFFDAHCRERLQAGAPLLSLVRLSRVAQAPGSLSPLQRLCHRDDSGLPADQMVSAAVHYLFRDETLGGTVFFRPRGSAAETRALLDEAGALDAAAFAARHPELPPAYMSGSNEHFELIGRVPARWNRVVFYSGAIFHSADIRAPQAAYAVGLGRLTANAFFKSRRPAAEPR